MKRNLNTVKIMKRVPALLAAVLVAQVAMAQNIDPTVEVKRDFDGRMINIHKSHLKSNIHDSLSNFNLSFNYSIFDKPYKDLYEFSPLPSADLQGKTKEKMPVFFAKGGVSFPFSPLAEIYWQPQLKKGNILQLNGFYNGFYSMMNTLAIDGESYDIIRNKDVKSYSSNTSYGVGGTYSYHWKNGALSLDMGYNGGSNTYYGFLTTPQMTADSPLALKIGNKNFMADSCSHNWQQFGAKFSIGSVDARVSKVCFHYKVNVGYTNTSDKYLQDKLSENLIVVSGEFGPTFGKYNRISIGFNSENVMYGGLKDYKYGIYEVIPQYTFEKGRFKVRGGVKLSGKYTDKDDAGDYHNSIFAVGEVSFEIAKRNLWLYGTVDGGNCINSYSMLLERNKWISQETALKASSVPLLVKGGFRGQVHNKFSYNLYAKYAVHKGLLQYIGIPGIPYPELEDSRLTAIYSNHREFSVGGELKWKSRSFTAGTWVEYSDYTRARNSILDDNHRAIGYAPFKWDLFATWNYRERIWAGITCRYRSATPTWNATYFDKEINYTPFLDLGINLQYAVNRTLSVYLKGENLLNNQIQYYPQYLEKGLSFGAGLLVKF